MTEGLRPVEILRDAGRRFPGVWRLFERFRAGRGKEGLPEWPHYVYVPLAAAEAVAKQYSVGPTWIARLGALAAWRVTQGVYRFHPEVYRAVIDTPITGAIPCELLRRLPEWCVYVETPGWAPDGCSVHGFFAHIEWDANTGHEELRLLVDGEEAFRMIPLVLHLGPWGLAEAVERTQREALRRMPQQPPAEWTRLVAGAMTGLARPMLALVLYLCSEAPDIEAEQGGPRRPGRPRPVRTKRGPRLYPPDRPTVWHTAFRLGRALQDARESGAGVEGRRGPRPHIRRAHWHTYWVGPKADPSSRRRVLRWLPPIPVGMEGQEELIPTIREVRF